MSPVRLAAAAVLSLALAGCISVFPKTTPAQLYEFGRDMPTRHAANAGAPPFVVLRAVTAFNQAAAGDRLLTTNGQSAAYIAGCRWVSPAAVLFDQAETAAFDVDDGPAKLARRGEIAGAATELRLEVPTFEARYPGDLKAAPTVVVKVRAELIDLSDRHVLASKTFESRQLAGDNRVGQIVRGFDAATTDVLGQLVDWTDSQAAAVSAIKG